MASSLLRKTMFISICIAIFFMIGLAACSTASGSGSSATPGTPTPNATAAVTALIKEMTFVGTPTAKIVSGTTFEVDGQIKNGDTKQHDIWVQAALFDASGKLIVATAPLNVDDTPGGATVPFAIQGTTPQPTWASFKVTVVNVTENVNGTGTD
jgi:hypothetical protein